MWEASTFRRRQQSPPHAPPGNVLPVYSNGSSPDRRKYRRRISYLARISRWSPAKLLLTIASLWVSASLLVYQRLAPSSSVEKAVVDLGRPILIRPRKRSDRVLIPVTKSSSTRAKRPNYNGIAYESVVGNAKEYDDLPPRLISFDDADRYHEEKAGQLKWIDDHTESESISYSDPGKFDHYDEQDYPKTTGCYRPKWSYEGHPTCSKFHEFSMFRIPSAPREWQMATSYIARGHFRDTWLMEDEQDTFVLKNNRFLEERLFSAYTMTQLQIETMIMEKTTWSNRTIAIFGYCGASVLVEKGVPVARQIVPSYRVMSREELVERNKDELQPANDLTPEERIYIALAMAESIALLHGHPEGPIVNNDLSLFQWLWDKDGNLKLNDFNKAKILQWNPTENVTCGPYNRYKDEYRSPEEFEGVYVDEMSETHGFGKVLYSLLTGLSPYFWIDDESDRKEAVIAGEYPPIDDRYRTRSFIDGRLVEVIEMLWPFEIKDRKTIFDAVALLRKTKQEYDEQQQRAKGRKR